uniref:Ubiquitinyl hydrolase 1 n=1 Tax=Panagrellus redivivus TaxID=6233 RepID=A0A7E4VH78_PANRE
MKLFQNETQNELARPSRLTILKSLVQVSVSREAIDYIVDVLNTSTLIENLEKVSYGMDENFFATLNGNEGIDLPGGFSTLCLDNGVHTQSITRTTTWSSNEEQCGSKKFRHWICIYGTEDLFSIVGQPGIVANKFMPEYDFGAVDCLLERMHNRSYGIDVPPREEIKLNYYKGLRHVRYHKARMENGGKRPTKFKC